MDKDIECVKIEEILHQNHAENIISIALSEKSCEFDNVIIASADSTRGLRAIAEKIRLHSKKDKIFSRIVISGMDSDGWIAIDLGETMIHLMKPETREYYNLEELWQNI